jgi:hypothetical protein
MVAGCSRRDEMRAIQVRGTKRAGARRRGFGSGLAG